MLGDSLLKTRIRRFNAVFLAAAILCLAAPPAMADDDDDDDDDDDEINLVQYLDSTGVDDNATAKARWKSEVESEEDGEEEEGEEEEVEQEFKLHLKKLAPDTAFEFFVEDVLRASFSTNGGGNAALEFESEDDDEEEEEEEEEGDDDDDDLEFAFDFEVFGQTLEVRDAEGTVYFSDKFEPGGMQPGGKKKNPKAQLEVLMANVSPDDFDARGRLHYKADKGKTSLKVKLDDLDPGLYDLCVDGASVLQFDTTLEDFEVVHLKFRDPPNGDDDDDEDDEFSVHAALDFDPLGAQIDVVLDKDTLPVVVLTAVMPVTKQAAGDRGQRSGRRQAKDVGRSKYDAVLFKLLNTGLMPGAVGAVVLEVDDVTGNQALTIGLKKLGDTTYSVMADDDGDAETDMTELGTVDVLNGKGEASFGVASEGDEALPDLRGRRIDLVVDAGTADADTIMSAILPTSLPAALDKLKADRRKFDKDTDALVRFQGSMHGTGVDIDATAKLRWQVKLSSGRETFEIQVKDLADGSYDMRVGGVLESSFEVLKGRAKLRFDSSLLEAKGNKLPMDFSPLDALVEIRDAADTAVLKAMVE